LFGRGEGGGVHFARREGEEGLGDCRRGEKRGDVKVYFGLPQSIISALAYEKEGGGVTDKKERGKQ